MRLSINMAQVSHRANSISQHLRQKMETTEGLVQQNVSAMAGFGVLIAFVFFIYMVSWDRSQLVGLGIHYRSFTKPS